MVKANLLVQQALIISDFYVSKNTKVIVVSLFAMLFESLFWSLKSYGTNIFVLMTFYINEFFFNLRLIIDDLAKIIYQILN